MHIVFDARVIERRNKVGVAWYGHRLLQSLVSVATTERFTLIFSSFRRKIPHISILPGERVKIHMAPVPSVLASAARGRFWFDVYLPWKLKVLGCNIFHGMDYSVPPPGPYRTVVTIHDLVAFVNPEFMTTKFEKRFRFFTQRALERATRVIVPSECVRACIAAHFPHFLYKVRVVHHGVDTIHFRQIEQSQILSFKKAHGLPEQYILYVGSMSNRKNPEVLVRAYARMKKAGGIATVLVLVGDIVDGQTKLSRAIEDSGVNDSIILYGYAPQEDLPYLYNGASAFVFPSLHEGFGMPVLEAMACGVPVIASAVTSLPEVVGDAGILFDPTSEEELAAALQAVLTDAVRADALRARGFERIKKFTWESTARKTMDVYREAVEERAHA